ncbi:ER membrane protein complex subunit 10-like [Mytilus californianus]|uniref:ER membrane protein complex subunit 10-like n=1 Tax=Mytilus californianus TaxID=6549 RepID=UPI002247E9F9|nr:ER membrane protein complex subunit 10-like [Mytilus californianus]
MSAPMENILLALILFLSTFIGVITDEEFEGLRTFTLEHSFDTGCTPVFTKRGTIAVRSVKSNRAHFSPNAPLSIEERNKLQVLADNNEIYRLRISVRNTGNSDEDYVTSYTPACGIYESSLSDHIWLHFDQSGELLGVSMVTEPSECRNIEVDSSDLMHWNTTVDITQTVQGPQPDTQTYIEKLKKEEMEKKKGQQSDNRSFFAKYWMYIVPFVLVMMLAGNTDQNAQGGGGR